MQTAHSQVLKAGFEKSQYIETLKINQKAHIPLEKWKEYLAVPDPGEFKFIYRSPSVAFDNIWDLWVHNEKPIAIIAIRGTVATNASFLANLYAAMVPAKGELELDKDFTFRYTLADHPNAAVHIGWLISMAYLSKTIESKIDSCYKAGIKDFILTGHSQGGGITYLLNAYLHQLKLENKISKDIQIKTYCSAAPKPGNLFFAYDYEKINEGGWAYNVVNTIDWVPDVPFSIQTVNDFTTINAFRNAKTTIKKQKFPKNILLNSIYNQLTKPGLKAQRKYEKYLGKMVTKAVKKQLPDFQPIEFFKSNYYVRTGSTIILNPDNEYFKIYNNDAENKNIWQHHHPEQYLFLAQKLVNVNNN